MRRTEHGYTFVVVLLMVAVTSAAAASVAASWQTRLQRERERALLQTGMAYVAALESYRTASPGNVKQFPAELAELVRDPRFVGVRRHMRQLYTDPVLPGKAVEPIRDAKGRVVGVRSTSLARPLIAFAEFPSAQSHADWRFLAKELN